MYLTSGRKEHMERIISLPPEKVNEKPRKAFGKVINSSLSRHTVAASNLMYYFCWLQSGGLMAWWGQMEYRSPERGVHGWSRGKVLVALVWTSSEH